MTVRVASLPGDALLHRYDARSDCYTDCYAAPVGAPDLATCITAFYSTPLFGVERLVLRLAGHPSTGADITALAAGADQFAAWTVEDRSPDQILLRDVTGRTRSWLCLRAGQLYFGSAVLPPRPGAGLGPVFTALLPLHKLYARALLAAAARRLRPLPPE